MPGLAILHWVISHGRALRFAEHISWPSAKAARGGGDEAPLVLLLQIRLNTVILIESGHLRGFAIELSLLVSVQPSLKIQPLGVSVNVVCSRGPRPPDHFIHYRSIRRSSGYLLPRFSKTCTLQYHSNGYHESLLSGLRSRHPAKSVCGQLRAYRVRSIHVDPNKTSAIPPHLCWAPLRQLKS